MLRLHPLLHSYSLRVPAMEESLIEVPATLTAGVTIAAPLG